jgi:hypothetical protein
VKFRVYPPQERTSMMEERIRWVDPDLIIPPHEIDDKVKHRLLVKKMLEEGWQGRPLLVEGLPVGGRFFRETMQGWTGSHRIAAALDAGIKLVPVARIDIERLRRRGIRRGTMKEGGSYWVSPDLVDMGYSDLLSLLEQIGDEDATLLMGWEMEAGWNEPVARLLKRGELKI